jgi:hypothetical protein
MEKNWIKEMIEMEVIPKPVRTETVANFCKRHGISERTYYYQACKEDNQEKIIKLSLNIVKSEVPEILQVLTDKAKSGDMKAIDTYLNSVVKLAKNLDIKSDGKPIVQLINSIAEKHGIVDNSTESDSK